MSLHRIPNYSYTSRCVCVCVCVNREKSGFWCTCVYTVCELIFTIFSYLGIHVCVCCWFVPYSFHMYFCPKIVFVFRSSLYFGLLIFSHVFLPPPPPQSTRNTVPVPRHWCFKRKYLQGKRGIEKPPFNLPEFIKVCDCE